MPDKGKDGLFAEVKGKGCEAKQCDEAISGYRSFHGADGEARKPVNLRKLGKGGPAGCPVGPNGRGIGYHGPNHAGKGP